MWANLRDGKSENTVIIRCFDICFRERFKTAEIEIEKADLYKKLVALADWAESIGDDFSIMM